MKPTTSAPAESFATGRQSSAPFRAVQTAARPRRVSHPQQPFDITEPQARNAFYFILEPLEAALLGIITVAVIALMTITGLARDAVGNGLAPEAPTSPLAEPPSSAMSSSLPLVSTIPPGALQQVPVVVRSSPPAAPQPAASQSPPHMPYGPLPGSSHLAHPGPEPPHVPASATVEVEAGPAEDGASLQETLSSTARLTQLSGVAATTGQPLAVICTSRKANARYGRFLEAFRRRLAARGYVTHIVVAAEADFRVRPFADPRAPDHAMLVACLQLAADGPTLPTLSVYGGSHVGHDGHANRLADFAQLMAVAPR